jgi:glycosyltransferase involved in cell wall biosynthesis
MNLSSLTMRISSIPISNNRLLFVSNCCWSLYNFRVEVLRHFITSGYEVHIIASKDNFYDLLLNEGCIIHPVAFNNRGRNFVKDIQFYFLLKKLYSEIKPALIFHYGIKPNIYGSIAGGLLKIPSVAFITGLGYGFIKNNLLQTIIKQLYKYALGNCTEVWFLNTADQNFFKQNNLVSKNKLRLLKSEGIDTIKFAPSFQLHNRSQTIFLMATRLLKSKGIELYAQAAEKLIQQGYDIECRLIGALEADHPDSISKKQLQQWSNKKIITYYGFKKNVSVHMQQCDCFLLPGYYHEGVPRSLMEASSMCIPVIAADVKGCKEVVVDEYNGFLFESRNVIDLSRKMEKMINMNVADRRLMGMQGRTKMLADFKMDTIINTYQTTTDRFVERIAQAELQPVA